MSSEEGQKEQVRIGPRGVLYKAEDRGEIREAEGPLSEAEASRKEVAERLDTEGLLQEPKIVVDEDDRLVAFGVTMPSLSRALQKSGGRLFPFGFIHLLRALHKGDRADLYLVAVRSEYQGKGVNAILMNEMAHVFMRRGIVKVETNPELETNQDVQGQWKHYDARQHRRRRCFIKRLS